MAARIGAKVHMTALPRTTGEILSDAVAMFRAHFRSFYLLALPFCAVDLFLREGAAVLFGAFSNDWTLRMNKDLRFQLELAPDGHRYVIDRERAGHRQWKGPLISGPFDGEYSDYAILTRIFDKTTGHPVLSVGGISHLATQAGGEFLLSVPHMNEALAKAGPGWEGKNLQIVITTKVIGSSASPPQFLAIHTW